MITSYKKSKNEVLTHYEKFLEMARSMEMSENDTSFKELKLQAERIKEEQFCLMIAGEAKGGKSTFIRLSTNYML